jgi:uncharacterized membrane protein
MSEPNVPPPPSYTPPPPPPSGFPPSGGGTVSPNRTIMIVLSYFGPLALIPLLIEKDDKEVQWHAKHGLVLFVLWIIFCVALAILAHIPFLGCLSFLVLPIVGLAFLVVTILCIVKGINGQRFLIPGVSPFADRF